MPKNSDDLTPVPDAASVNVGEQTNRTDSLTEKEFISLIRRGEGHKLNGRKVLGDMNLVGESFLKPLVIRGTTFTGEVNFNKCCFEREVDFTGCRFERRADFTGCRFEHNLILSDAHVKGPLILDDVVIGEAEPVPNLAMIQRMIESLKEGCRRVQPDSKESEGQRISNGRICKRRQTSQHKLEKRLEEAKEQLRQATTLHADPQIVAEFTNLSVAGCLSMLNARVFGSLSCNYSDIEDDFRIDESRIHGDLRLRCTSLGEFLTDWKESSVAAGVTAEGQKSKPCLINGRIDLTSAKVAGDARFVGVNIGDELSLQTTDINGNLLCRASAGRRVIKIRGGAWFLGVRVRGVVDFSGARVGSYLMMPSAEIGSLIVRFMVNQTQIEGSAYLNGIRIRGSAELLGLILQGELNLENASIGGDIAVAFDLKFENDWQIVRSRVGSRIHAELATIGKRVILMGLDVGPTDRKGNKVAEAERESAAMTKEIHGVNFNGAEINGQFLTYSKETASEVLETKKVSYPAEYFRPERENQVIEKAAQGQTVIQGYLRLSRARLLSGLTLSGVKIRGDLDLRDVNVRANIECKPHQLSSGEFICASIQQVNMEALETTGDINLTGLAIEKDLVLRDARIRGSLKLNPSADEQKRTDNRKQEAKEDFEWKCADMRTCIGGKLYLDAAEISQVILSGKSFKERAKSEEAYVILERAVIGQLEIAYPLPGTLDLSDLKVGSWKEPVKKKESGLLAVLRSFSNVLGFDPGFLKKEDSFFIETLKNSEPFRRSSYLAIERDLRNKGEDEEADAVHVEMRRRDRRQTKKFWNRLPDFIFDAFTKYGTTSARLFWIMLLSFIFTIWLFSNPTNVKYKSDPSAQPPSQSDPSVQPPPQVAHPRPEDWNVGDAVFLAVRLHVPIVSLGIEEEVQPSGTVPKAYAVLIVAASWVMWPLFIASVSGFLRRRKLE